jgi:hypothetical protein
MAVIIDICESSIFIAKTGEIRIGGYIPSAGGVQS